MSRGFRRKIEMKLIKNKRNHAVKFSKRHGGLFKKASEFVALFCAQIAIILFTISGKPLAFGSPCVVDVTKKFLSSSHGDDEPDATLESSVSSLRIAKVEELNNVFDEFNGKSVLDKKFGQTLDEDLKMFLGGKTYMEYKSSMGIDQLMQMKYKLEQVRKYLQDDSDEESETSVFTDECQPDLSNIEGPRDFLRL